VVRLVNWASEVRWPLGTCGSDALARLRGAELRCERSEAAQARHSRKLFTDLQTESSGTCTRRLGRKGVRPVGADIRGWVEVRDATLDEDIGEILWSAVIDAGSLLSRNYTMFGALFGVRNHSDFKPVAGGRGLPDPVSPTVKTEATEWDDYHSHTWVSWRELKAVDWDERDLAGLAFGYRKGEESHSIGKYLDRSDSRRGEGSTWSEGDTTYRVETITRREALGRECELLFRLMEILAERYGDDYVRLVVWFFN
jgi:hypothetical protein